MVDVIIYAKFQWRKYWGRKMVYYRKVKHYTAPSSIISMSILIDFLRYYMTMGKFLIVYSYCFGGTNYRIMAQYENSFSLLIKRPSS